MKQAFVVTGVKEIDKKLKTLVPRLGKKVIRKSMRNGMKLMAAEVKSQVPVDTGLTRQNVKVRAVKKRSRNKIEIEVRIAGEGEGGEGLIKTSPGYGRAFYPAIVTYGSKKQPANPFMQRSFAAKGEIVRQYTIQDILNGIEEEVARG